MKMRLIRLSARGAYNHCNAPYQTIWCAYFSLIHSLTPGVSGQVALAALVALIAQVGQGRILSTHNYKLSIDPLLKLFSTLGFGCHIGTQFFKKESYWSEMARNATESDFRTSKMAAGRHFVKNIPKIKIVVLIWNGKKCDTSSNRLLADYNFI